MGERPRIVFLTGFMGTGKSAVGEALARRLGLPFVDTDREIERRAGMTVAGIFRERGEAAFRVLEREAVAEACAGPGAVVATGGGAVLDPESRARMEQSGIIVCLEASPEVILERIGPGESRPLLAGAADPLERIRELLERRAPVYASLPFRVDAATGDPDEVAAGIVRRLGEAP